MDTGHEWQVEVAEKDMRTWRKLYFGIALLSAAFLAESFLPVPLF